MTVGVVTPTVILFVETPLSLVALFVSGTTIYHVRLEFLFEGAKVWKRQVVPEALFFAL